MKKIDKKNGPGNKDIAAEIKEEFKRHTNILMEQMRHEVKTVAEGHSIVIRKLEDHDKEFVELDKKIGKVESDVIEVKTDVRAIKSELHSMNMALMETSHEAKDHEKRIKKIEEKVLV